MVCLSDKSWGTVPEDTREATDIAVESKFVGWESGIRMKEGARREGVKSVKEQDRWGLQSLPLPAFICSAHPCMWESVCSRLSQGLSITPFTQSWKFSPVVICRTSLELLWISRGERCSLQWGKSSLFCSGFAFLQHCLSMWAARGGQMAAKNPASHLKWEVLHNTYNNTLKWSVSLKARKRRSLHISKCRQTYSVCLWNDIKWLHFWCCTKFFFILQLFVLFFFFFCWNHVFGQP